MSGASADLVADLGFEGAVGFLSALVDGPDLGASLEAEGVALEAGGDLCRAVLWGAR